MRERVTFQAYINEPDGSGGFDAVWSDHHTCRARFIYHTGNEAVHAARLTGVAVYKVVIRSCPEARQITTDMRMRDDRRGTIYNIREADNITDPALVYIVAESGVAA